MAEYYFNLPTITQLNIGQQEAMDEPNPIAISGGPGTGKSVVSLWRHIRNYASIQDSSRPKKRSLLLTYTTTLAKYLSKCCRIQSLAAANNVRRSWKGKPKSHEQWDEIIIDEAQDLPISYYEEIEGIAPISYGADDSQILYPDSSSTEADLQNLFPDNEPYVLDRNYRNTYCIMQFAKKQFPQAVIPYSVLKALSDDPDRIGMKPSLLITNGSDYDRTNDEQDEAIINIINEFHDDEYNIAILVPWKSDVQIFEKVLTDNGIDDFSVYYEDKSRFPDGAEEINNIHITTFKSAKGLEFDTVIIPNFHKINNILGSFNTEWNDYYVAVTRAKNNLYLISNHNMPHLRDVVEISIL